MKRAFEVKQKPFFIISKGTSAVKNWLRPESVPFKIKHNKQPKPTEKPIQ